MTYFLEDFNNSNTALYLILFSTNLAYNILHVLICSEEKNQHLLNAFNIFTKNITNESC